MRFKVLRRYLYFYVLPLIFLLGAGSVFVFWAENEMQAPGGVRDIQFWEGVMSSSDMVGDLQPLSGYLRQRNAEILVSSGRNMEGLLLFEFMGKIIQESSPERRLPDLKYALAIYKKQLFLSSSPIVKFYDDLRGKLKLGENYSYPSHFRFKSDFQKKTLAQLKKSEGEESVPAVIAAYQKALAHPEFSSDQTSLMLQLAYFLYERKPEEALRWIRKLEKQNFNPAVQKAAEYLKEKILKLGRISTKETSLGAQLTALMSMGLFEQAAKKIADSSVSPQGFSSQVSEISSWLKQSSKNQMGAQRPFLSEYFDALQNMSMHPIETSETLASLANDKNAWGYSAILRYQAWTLAYFDAKNFGQASFFSQLLKTRDPMSPYSRLESMKGLFQSSEKNYTGSKLLQLWKAEPYRFEMVQKKENWIGFKNSSNRVSTTLVHEGQVYVLNYNAEGRVINLQRAVAGESAGEDIKEKVKKKPPALKESVKASWMDSFFYDYMIRYIPFGVRTFKEQIAKAAQRLEGPVFERFYSDDEFQTYVLNRMRTSMGSEVGQIQAQIEEDGFRAYSVLSLNNMKISATGLGKLLVADDGQLILKLDHVKVGRVYLPEWLLRRVEKNFNRTANFDDASRSTGIDILEMKYRAGGILIKCEKRS